jgi:aldehyde oxidoreductase
MLDRPSAISFILNGAPAQTHAAPMERLSAVLRDHLRLDGTKSGCDAGDCGACTVSIDGALACACLVPAGQISGSDIMTVEGIVETEIGQRLADAFHEKGAAQCGICTPGMMVAAHELLARRGAAVHEAEVRDALGGVLCRCTGYAKIIEAVLAAARASPLQSAADPRQDQPDKGRSLPVIGRRMKRLDGLAKIRGTERFGADGIPADALFVRAIRSPHHHAAFTIGDVAGFLERHPGILRVLTAADVPGRNRHGVIPPFADQPVFAETETRFRGEAIAAIIGERDAVKAFDPAGFPVEWTKLPHLLSLDEALAPDAPPLHPNRAGNILVRGHVACGEAEAALAEAAIVVEGQFETGFVEHAYIEPEAGWASRKGNRIEITASTQSPVMDRDDTAAIMGLPPEAIRIIPSACGGGFGSKLDLSVQPYIALASWLTGRPCAMVYSRAESMASTTKRHPARIHSRIGASAEGRIVAMDFDADFNTGAYASWGPTVANRVPVHASGPYVVPNYRARTRAVHTHCVPAGAFRGFGVPQTVIAQEQLLDMLAQRLGMDALEFRLKNALDGETPTVTGQVLGAGVGFRACLEALKPHWQRARREAETHNASSGRFRRGAGLAGMWYGCGNTSMSNPSTIRFGLKPDGRLSLHQGAVDIGQGSNTVIAQIAADAVGLPFSLVDLVGPDTDLTPDCGKTSASRQTFVTGKAAELAGRALRAKALRLANAGEDAPLALEGAILVIGQGADARRIDLRMLPQDSFGYALTAEESFDPPTTPLDANGQGDPYALYGFGAHLAELEVDTRLGTVRLIRITAAHDVGRAINPTLVEGQIEGGIAQGIGLALMEEFTPGRGENLHDYLISTIGDMPEIVSLLIEEASPAGPFGAKGIGEQALIPTAPAILNAIHHATGVRMMRVPALPDRLRAAILAAGRFHSP